MRGHGLWTGDPQAQAVRLSLSAIATEAEVSS